LDARRHRDLPSAGDEGRGGPHGLRPRHRRRRSGQTQPAQRTDAVDVHHEGRIAGGVFTRRRDE
jgi:hypothetical protein